ncbi:MAG TPA: non-homologous end-joining DNA ligase [Vicinamibacterales bacterium]|jgi:bifunctional non-homologous end joining protein LigD|nr:non-homologous end-joining DNA ligase [Vicinamibacterales bacterium]
MARSFPEWVVPMAATLTDKRFKSPEWIFERKLDGIRVLAFKRGKDVQLYSRNRLPQSNPVLAEAIAALPAKDAILDGEVTGVWGPPTMREADQARRLAYHVFDLLWLDGRDLMDLPLSDRRAALAGLPLRRPLHHVDALDDPEPWERACREGWEGVIAKRLDAPYEHRRSPHWLKMKCEASQELVIGGFTDPQGSRVGLGALLVGFFEGNDFVFAGKVGTGFNTKLLLDLRARLDAIALDTPPFTKAVGLPRLRAHWVKPTIVVQVAFTEWTVYGKLRHPKLLGVRTDKNAREVVRERPS